MNYKKYLELVCEGDITSVRAKMQAKQRGLVHQSHNVWKDKSGQEFKWDEQGKKFENVESEIILGNKSYINFQELEQILIKPIEQWEFGWGEVVTLTINRIKYKVATELWEKGCMESRGFGLPTSEELIKRRYRDIMAQEFNLRPVIAGYLPKGKSGKYGVSYIAQPIGR